MRSSGTKSNAALGFFTVVNHAEQGLVGGYLVLNRLGRPLEFHCTAPVKASRAQQILYGPTLEPYLFGEQIGQTLLNKASAEPLVVCTDCEAGLALREFVQVPVALLVATEAENKQSTETGSSRMFRRDASHASIARTPVFLVGKNRLAVSSQAADDQQRICEQLGSWGEQFDLQEPFQRIREAIEEARRGGQ